MPNDVVFTSVNEEILVKYKTSLLTTLMTELRIFVINIINPINPISCPTIHEPFLFHKWWSTNCIFFLFCFSFDNKPNQLAFSQVLLFQNLFKYIFSKGLTRYSINNKVCKYTTIPTRVSLLNFQSGACYLKVHQKSSSEE